MAHWIITYKKDNGTSTLDMQADRKPSMETTVEYVLDWASHNLEKGEYGDHEDKLSDEPAAKLLRKYGITIAGISKA
ncbi:hypothetical protein [Metapseudomonas resinovorans]|uniref:Uncharacterized protein n=1 Tax=Metapseudomonas resinovorans NBRC 106553 TaxID=1245471 RepID=S6AFE4_METRE|nr:hypothetical protein [Pseudomonas resinovorans]BAN48667.1 hypothetical protein PCA10_29350 [Pseudomonas resinovorans NBRC 106553]